MDSVIRPFAAHDRDALVALWRRCDLIRPQNDPHRDIDRKIAHDPDNLLVLSVESVSEIIGSVMVGYDGHRGWINYLAVDPRFQGQGWGRRLMDEAERQLRDLGCPKINLQVRTSNASALTFYRQIGFEIDDVVSLGKRLIDE